MRIRNLQTLAWRRAGVASAIERTVVGRRFKERHESAGILETRKKMCGGPRRANKYSLRATVHALFRWDWIGDLSFGYG